MLDKEIGSLAQSFGYILLVICLLRIALPYARNKANLSSYIYLFNVVFLLPAVFMVALFHKMVGVSAKVSEEDIRNENDLL